MAKRYQITLDIDPDLYARLENSAAEKGMTIREFCLAAIEQRVRAERVLGPDPVLEELWNNEDDAVYDNL